MKPIRIGLVVFVLAFAVLLFGDWGTEIACTQATTVSDGAWTSITCPGTFTAEDHEIIDLYAKVDNESGSVIDNLEVRVVSSPDGGTDVSVNAVVCSIEIEPTGITAETHHVCFVPPLKTPTIQARSTGTTDDYTVDFSFLKLVYDGAP